MTSEQNERMSDEQIDWAIGFCKRVSRSTPIIQTGIEYVTVAEIITQLRTALAKKDALLAEAVVAMENLIDCHAVEWGASHPTTLQARTTLSRLTTANERREQGKGERGGVL